MQSMLSSNPKEEQMRHPGLASMRRAHEAALLRIKERKPSLSAAAPVCSSMAHLRQRRKAQQLKESRSMDIKRNNERLVAKMAKIITETRSPWENCSGNFNVARASRKKANDKVAKANEDYLRRISAIKPYYDQRAWQRDRNSQVKILKRLDKWRGSAAVPPKKKEQERDKAKIELLLPTENDDKKTSAQFLNQCRPKKKKVFRLKKKNNNAKKEEELVASKTDEEPSTPVVSSGIEMSKEDDYDEASFEEEEYEADHQSEKEEPPAQDEDQKTPPETTKREDQEVYVKDKVFRPGRFPVRPPEEKSDRDDLGAFQDLLKDLSHSATRNAKLPNGEVLKTTATARVSGADLVVMSLEAKEARASIATRMPTIALVDADATRNFLHSFAEAVAQGAANSIHLKAQEHVLQKKNNTTTFLDDAMLQSILETSQHTR